MNDLAWARRESRLIEAHAAADPPLSPALWRGLEARLAGRPRRRSAWLGVAVAVLAAAVGVVLWLAPGDAGAPPGRAATAAVEPAGTAPAPIAPIAPIGAVPGVPGAPAEPGHVAEVGAPGPQRRLLNQVMETRGPVTVVIQAGAGRVEVEPCGGRFVNATVLGSSHSELALVERRGRIAVELDGGLAMADGVAHVMVPRDTRLIITTHSGGVVVRGLGGPLQVTSQSGNLQLDTAPSSAPDVSATTETGAIRWQGRCGRGCRVAARSDTGDITLRASDPAAFTRGAARAESARGQVHLERLTCDHPRCVSPPLSWRSPAGQGH